MTPPPLALGMLIVRAHRRALRLDGAGAVRGVPQVGRGAVEGVGADPQPGRAAAAGRLLGLALPARPHPVRRPAHRLGAADRRVLPHQRRVRLRRGHDGARRAAAAGLGVDPRVRPRALARDGARRPRRARCGTAAHAPRRTSTTTDAYVPRAIAAGVHARPSRSPALVEFLAPAASAGVRLDAAAAAPGRARAAAASDPAARTRAPPASSDAPPPPRRRASSFAPRPDADSGRWGGFDLGPSASSPAK